MDSTLYHELNHAFETRTTKEDNKSGWQIFLSEEENQKINLLDEAINHIIENDLLKLSRKKGIYIFDDHNDYEKSKNSFYSKFLPLVTNFFNRYKDIIILSRYYGLDLLTEYVGKDNFYALRDLINEYQEYYDSHPLIKDRRTEEFIVRSETILEQMMNSEIKVK